MSKKREMRTLAKKTMLIPDRLLLVALMSPIQLKYSTKTINKQIRVSCKSFILAKCRGRSFFKIKYIPRRTYKDRKMIIILPVL